MTDFPTPSLFDARARWDPLEFPYFTKTRGMGLPYGENFTILSSTVLYESPVCDERTVSGRVIA